MNYISASFFFCFLSFQVETPESKNEPRQWHAASIIFMI